MNELKGKVALVTGASRGIGAIVARMLAIRGADVAINYRSKLSRAENVAGDVRVLGRRALLVQADITNADDIAKMTDTINREYGRLDVLVLNASGGLEKGKASDYAMRLNLTSQVRLVDSVLPLMPRGGRIVFVTSHLAHFHGKRPATGAYAVVAASKFAGEQALHARASEFSDLGIGFVVVSGDMIEGTITPRLLERIDRGIIASRVNKVGFLPTIDEFASAIAEAASTPRIIHPVVFVGDVE